MSKHLTPDEIKNLMNRQYNKKLDSKVQAFAPQVYASMVITLMDYYGWQFEDIKTLIEYNEEVWNRCARNGERMIEKCSREYGIDIVQLVGGNRDGDGIDYRWKE